MDNKQLEAQSRAAIIAHLTDPSVQLEYTDRGIEAWNPIEGIGVFNLMYYHYRIAKPRKWYRVAKLSGGITITADNDMGELSIKNDSSFIEWLDERKYYD